MASFPLRVEWLESRVASFSLRAGVASFPFRVACFVFLGIEYKESEGGVLQLSSFPLAFDFQPCNNIINCQLLFGC